MSANAIKEKLMFVASVGLAVAAIYYVQDKWFQVPVIGKYLPGGK
jgi:hypothetical protein